MRRMAPRPLSMPPRRRMPRAATTRLPRVLLALGISGLLLAGCAAPSAPAAGRAPSGGEPGVALAAPAPTALNYATTTLGWNLAPQMVAQDKGFFAAEGLNVDIVIAGQSATVCQQLLARAVEVGGCSLNDSIQTIESSGAPSP